MKFLLDIIIIAIIVISAFLSAKKGFVRAAVEVAGFAAAIFLSLSLSGPIADMTYEKIIEKPLVSAVSSSGEVVVDKIWDKMPDMVKNNPESIGFSKEDVEKIISDNPELSGEDTAFKISETLVKPPALKLLEGIFRCLLFIVLMIAVHILAGIVNKLFSFSVIGKLNSGLGAVLGIVKGVLYSLAFVAITVLISSLSNGDFLIFTDENIAGSMIYRMLAEITTLYPFK